MCFTPAFTPTSKITCRSARIEPQKLIFNYTVKEQKDLGWSCLPGNHKWRYSTIDYQIESIPQNTRGSNVARM